MKKLWYQGKIWLNNKIITVDEANCSLLAHSLHYGTAVFEGIRVYNKKIFAGIEHFARLHFSAQTMGYDIPYSIVNLYESVQDLIEINNLNDAYVRPIAWLGGESLDLGLLSASHNRVNVAIMAWSWDGAITKSVRNKGLNLMWSPWRKPNSCISPLQAKTSSSYGMNSASKTIAIREGYDDVLFLDINNNVAEGSGANIFVIRGNNLYTPPVSLCLNGITRQTLIKLASLQGINIEEIEFDREFLLNSDAAFFTGTAVEVVPINSILDHSFSANDLLIKLQRDYYDFVSAN